jgi:hypothetical protein
MTFGNCCALVIDDVSGNDCLLACSYNNGDAVRWGITNKVDAWEKCCEQCLNFQPSPGKPTCNGEAASVEASQECLLWHVLDADPSIADIAAWLFSVWVWCGDKATCGDTYQECWLKYFVSLWVLWQ